MSENPPVAPQSSQPSSRALSAGAITALVIGTFLATLVMAGLCAGLFFLGGPSVHDALEQANVPVPTVRPNVNDWWTQRVLSEVYTGALDAVVADKGVMEHLGEPVETDIAAEDLFIRVNAGQLDPKNEAIEFEVLGPKARGTVRVTAAGVGEFGVGNGPLQIKEITVKLEDGKVIEIDPPPERNVQVR